MNCVFVFWIWVKALSRVRRKRRGLSGFRISTGTGANICRVFKSGTEAHIVFCSVDTCNKFPKVKAAVALTS
jgi:hypothetical protein